MKKNLWKLPKRILSVILTFALVIGTLAVAPVRVAALNDNIVGSVEVGQTYMFRNKQSGLYLTALSDNTVEQRAFDGQSNQQWRISNELNSIWPSYDGFDVRPLSDLSLLLDMDSILNNADVNVQEARTVTPTNQMWDFVYQNDGASRIKCVRNGRIVGLSGNRAIVKDDNSNLDSQWEVIKPGTVTYDRNGGTSVSRPNATLWEGAAVDLSPTAYKPNAQFLGWHTNQNATAPLSSLTMPGDNVTLYAIYLEQKTVTYDYLTNGGNSVTKTSETMYPGTQVNYSAVTATKANGKFLGWSTTANGAVLTSAYVMPDNNVTLYAIFENAKAVTYDYATNGGISATKTSALLFTNDPVDLTPSATRPNATFVGWNTNQNATTRLNSLAMPNTNLTIYAIFNPLYAITYDFATNGGTSATKTSDQKHETEAIDLTPTAAKAGFTFVGWNTNRNATTGLSTLTMATADVTLYAIYKQDTTVNFVDSAGTRGVTITRYNNDPFPPVTPPALRFPAGWTALGWSHQTAGNASPTPPESDGRLPYYGNYYGLYSEPVTLTYDANGGSMAPKADTKSRFFNSYDLNAPVDPVFFIGFGAVKSRYQFAGWAIDGTTYNENDQAVFNENKTLTAVWNEISVDGINISCYTLVLNQGATANIEAFVTPADATNQNFTWQSSAPSVVAIDQNGNITAVGDGSATITATTQDGNKTASCNVTVMLVANPVSDVEISAEDATLIIGESKQLTATMNPPDATMNNVNWSSSDPDVATVSGQGLVQSVGVGQAVITVTSVQGGKSASCLVTVEPINVANVALSDTNATLIVNEMKQLTATVSPPGATDKRCLWSSSDTDVADVTGSGLVIAKKVGAATITAETMDGQKIAACIVTVKPIPVSEIKVSLPNTTFFVGETVQLGADVLPENAADKRYTWSSGDEKVAVVSSDGLVRGVNVGTVTITATAVDGGIKASCTVTVLPILMKSVALTPASAEIDAKQMLEIKAAILPANTTDKTLAWSSSDPSIVTVSQQGVVTGVRPGAAVITAAAKDGSGRSATCKITVRSVMVSSIAMTPASKSMYAGDSDTLKAAVLPGDATNQEVIWSSSNASIATVSQTGKVIAVSAGTATVTATAKDGSGKKATCAVTVAGKPVAVSGVTVSPLVVFIMMDRVAQLSAKVTPENALNKKVLWNSSDTSIASVNSDGLVTGLKASDDPVTITVTTYEGGFTAECIIQVVTQKTYDKMLKELDSEAEIGPNGELVFASVGGGGLDIAIYLLEFFFYYVLFGWIWGSPKPVWPGSNSTPKPPNTVPDARWPFQETDPLQGFISALDKYPSGNTHSGKSGWGGPMDIATGGNNNFEVRAAEGGTVARDYQSGGYGNYIIITHSDGSKSIYAHMNNYSVEDGATVSKGTTIGIAGKTGNSTGIHLHFEFSDRHAWTYFKGKYGFPRFQWDASYPGHPTS